MINLHLYPTPLTHESRMLKETQAIADFGNFDRVVMVGTSMPGLPDSELLASGRQVIRIARTAPAGMPAQAAKAIGTVGWSARVLQRFGTQRVACVNCHSLPVLPLAVALKSRTGARLVYDTHELETEANGLGGLRRSVSKLVERSLIGFVDETIVVSDGIADWYQRAYGGRRPAVVLNAPPKRDPQRSSRLREAVSVPGDATLFLYQGILGRGRGIELLLESFEGLDDPRRVLVFMGMGPLEARIADAARRRPNVRLHPAVPPQEIAEYTASADVGMCLIEDTCLSYRYCMPNKLFEYFAAGVPAVVSNLPEIARVVTQSDAGWVLPAWTADAVRSVVVGINAAAIEARREAVSRAADLYSWERQIPVLHSVYERLGFVSGPQK